MQQLLQYMNYVEIYLERGFRLKAPLCSYNSNVTRGQISIEWWPRLGQVHNGIEFIRTSAGMANLFVLCAIFVNECLLVYCHYH